MVSSGLDMPKPSASSRRVKGDSSDEADDAPLMRSPSPLLATSLDEIVGHAGPKAVLRDAMSANRLHHAWIFTGPQGVGKFTAAYAFAAELLAGDAYGDRMLASGQHPELRIIRKELALHSEEASIRSNKQTSISKKVIEEFMIEEAGKGSSLPGRLAKRVFIIDEAELLDRSIHNAPTQNTLLKLLEEPPAGTIIILVTLDDYRLITTVRSRCQRVAFSSLSREECLTVLRQRADAAAADEARSAELAEQKALLAAANAPKSRRKPMAEVEVEVDTTDDDDAYVVEWVAFALPADLAELSFALDFAENSPGGAIQVIAQDMYSWGPKLSMPLSAMMAGQLGWLSLGSTMNDLVEAQAKRQAGESKQSSKESANRYWARKMFAAVAMHLRKHIAKDALRVSTALDCLSQSERQLDANVALSVIFDNLTLQLGSVWARNN